MVYAFVKLFQLDNSLNPILLRGKEPFILAHKISDSIRRIIIIITMVFFVARDNIIFPRKDFRVAIQNIGNIFSTVHWPLRYYLAKPVTTQPVILDKHEYCVQKELIWYAIYRLNRLD